MTVFCYIMYVNSNKIFILPYFSIGKKGAYAPLMERMHLRMC